MNEKEPPLYRASYELTLGTSRFIKDFHPEYKQTLGLILQERVLEMQTAIYQINEKSDKILAIQVAIDHSYFIKMMFRLILDLGLMKLETNIKLFSLLEDCIKQLSGWKRSLS